MKGTDWAVDAAIASAASACKGPGVILTDCQATWRNLQNVPISTDAFNILLSIENPLAIYVLYIPRHETLAETAAHAATR